MKSKAMIAAMAAGALVSAATASGQMRITEWMYQGGDGEFIEFTNMGNAPIDMAGWRYDDDSALYASGFDLTGFGIVMPGESVLITESTPEAFRTAWGLAPTVKVLGPFTNNLGRNDEINLFDASQTIVDTLTYGDQAILGSIRTQNRSGSPLSLAALGANDALQWDFSDTGAGGLSWWLSANGDTGNPGVAIPTPGSVALLGIAGLTISRRRRAA